MSVLAVDWGDVPTWVSAITTLGALIAAAILIGVEVRRDKDARERLERAEQADKVAVWHVDPDGSYLAARFVVQNGSTLPIYRTIVNIRAGRDYVHYPLRQVIPPGEHTFEYPSDVRPISGDTHLQLWFIDTARRGWQRGFNGGLRRLSEDEQNDVIGIRLSTEPGSTKRPD